VTVFAVLAHGDSTTFEVTADALRSYEIVVHVDASTDIRPYPRAENISYVEDRVNVRWGGFSVVSATDRLYALALEKCVSPEEYVVLLSGQCVPVRPLADLERLFSENPGRLYCRGGLLLDGLRQNERRVRKRWYFDKFDARQRGVMGRVFAGLRRVGQWTSGTRSARAFDGLAIVAGSQWTALTAGALQSLLSNTDLRVRLDALLRHSLAPDEIYFHSLVYSSEWAQRTLEWPPLPKSDKRTTDFANLHFVDRSLTRVISPLELAQLSVGDAFFARKVVSNDRRSLEATVRKLIAPREED